jgi:type I restriction enzyme S subunit
MIPVRLPPVLDQHRIVSQAEQLLTICDEFDAKQKERMKKRGFLNASSLNKLLSSKSIKECKKNWHFISDNFDLLYECRENVEGLRKAILQLAVQGKLVRQNPKDEPASKLLERIRKEKERLIEEGKIKKSKPLPPIDPNEVTFEVPNGWEWVRWRDISDWITYGFTRPMPHVPKGIPIVTAKNVIDRRINFETIDHTTKEAYEKLSPKDRPRKGDILLTKDGSIGRAAIVRDSFEFCINQSVAVIWLEASCIDSRYLLCVIDSPITQEPIWEKAKGAAIKHISITDFGKLLLPVPPLPEQQRIVAKVDQLMKLCDELQEKLKQSGVDSDRLMEAAVNQILAA